MTFDHPHIRNDSICPLCGGPKSKGLVACWRCYDIHELRYGNQEAEEALDLAEALLRAEAEYRAYRAQTAGIREKLDDIATARQWRHDR